VFVALKKQRVERVELFLDEKRYLLHKLLFKILRQLNITILICMNIYNYFIFSLEQQTNGKDMNGENVNDKDVHDEINNDVINHEDIYSEECSNDGIQTRSRTVRGRRNRKVTTGTTRAINRRTRGRVIFFFTFF